MSNLRLILTGINHMDARIALGQLQITGAGPLEESLLLQLDPIQLAPSPGAGQTDGRIDIQIEGEIRSKITEHRLRVLMAVGNTHHPSSAPEILEIISGRKDINRVTVYRILDLLVKHEVLNRLGLGEKPQRFCLRSEHEDEHPHFHCTRCDCYICLDQHDLPLDVRHVDIRLEGVCPACREKASRS